MRLMYGRRFTYSFIELIAAGMCGMFLNSSFKLSPARMCTISVSRPGASHVSSLMAFTNHSKFSSASSTGSSSI